MRYFAFLIALCALCACTPDAEQIEEQIVKLQYRIAIDPNNIEIHYKLGNAHLTLGRYEQGASHLKDAVRLSKKHIRYG